MVCPFCQQATEDAFTVSLNEYFDDAFEADSSAIDELITNYTSDSERLQQQVASVITNPSKFLDVEKLKAEKELLDSRITINVQKLTTKKKSPVNSLIWNQSATLPLQFQILSTQQTVLFLNITRLLLI